MARYLRSAYSGSARAGSLRRKTSWEEGPESQAGGGGTTSQSASGSVILGTGAQVTEDGLTLTRVRGRIEVMQTTGSSSSDRMRGCLGLGICTSEAFAVGVTAIPTPQSDPDWDGWLWWMPFTTVGAVTSSYPWGPAAMDFMIDTRSMRKLNLGDTIFMAAEVIEVGTAVIEYFMDTRLLLKLP